LLSAAAGDPSALGDLTQEVFLTVYEQTGYDPARGSVSAFLTTMTRSRAIDRLRRRGRSVRLLRTWHEATPPVRGPFTPLERVSMQQCADRVRAALSALPDAEREVLELAYYKGLSQAEIAADLDTPLGTVKSRSRRALIALKQTLGDLMG